MVLWIKLDSHGLFNDPTMVYFSGESLIRIPWGWGGGAG